MEKVTVEIPLLTYNDAGGNISVGYTIHTDTPNLTP